MVNCVYCAGLVHKLIQRQVFSKVALWVVGVYMEYLTQVRAYDAVPIPVKPCKFSM